MHSRSTANSKERDMLARRGLSPGGLKNEEQSRILACR